ncbi:hypothetical protein GN330_23270 [Nitratireductor sp. CAU 1489]|uniref:Gfo/Idh/MocA-like oxidoreductase N-terminal domain-containing protein n=1 Tax=Nitratireductor arenosus TaxID=2682096 RepID=A0A844QQT9_9HYPH|nr:Gfo/Idh/MocA family oxidoreductase [Nitratireductor arenosus]MVB00172.1 hypothetical protein [Nitratireductor arenosus]
MHSDLDQSIIFKIKKVLRYNRLYGPRRTLIKVRGQYHMASKTGFDGAEWINPACRDPDHPDRWVGIIGCGNFSFSNIAYYLGKESSRFLRATHDIARPQARSLCAFFGGAYAAGDPRKIIEDEAIRLVYIASNHASHAEYAIACLDAGKHVHIEKPHVISDEQLKRLSEAQRRNPQCMIFLGFNRPRSKLFERARDALEKEDGPLMVNWFLAGHSIPDDHWYFSEEEGGRILGNLCHWTDLTLELVGHEKAFPCTITAIAAPQAKSDFAISFLFDDGSVAGITFSAKGHTFEGVRETLNAHRGDVLLTLSDFKTLRLDRVEKKSTTSSFFRDHGHRANVINSYIAVRDGDNSKATSLQYSRATAKLFLGVKEAVDLRTPVVVNADESESLNGQDRRSA